MNTIEIMATYGIFAISTRGTFTFVFGDLHKSLFTGAASGIRLATRFLKSNCSEKDGGYCRVRLEIRNGKFPTLLTPIILSIFFEKLDIGLTSLEGTVGCFDRLAQLFSNDYTLCQYWFPERRVQ